jgi:hypothetical protein
MNVRFLRRGVNQTAVDVLEVTLDAALTGSSQSPQSEVLCFKVQRHGKVVVVLWQKTQLGTPDHNLAKLVFEQLVQESKLIFIAEKGDVWNFTKEPAAVPQ